MIADQKVMAFFSLFYPTASATAYGQRPKFFRAEHSATAKGENCAYGPTLVIRLRGLQGQMLFPPDDYSNFVFQAENLTITCGHIHN